MSFDFSVRRFDSKVKVENVYKNGDNKNKHKQPLEKDEPIINKKDEEDVVETKEFFKDDNKGNNVDFYA